MSNGTYNFDVKIGTREEADKFLEILREAEEDGDIENIQVQEMGYRNVAGDRIEDEG